MAVTGVSPAVAANAPNYVAVGSQRPVVINESFINPWTEAFGRIAVGRHVFVAPNAILRADGRRRVCLGNATNVQDNVLVIAERGRAPKARCARRSTSTGRRVSIAHQADVRNSRIGNFTFIGFRSRLRNVALGNGAFVLHGATVSNVRIGRNRLVPTGAVITTQAQADALPVKTEAHSDFQREVLEVNEEFAEHYPDLYKRKGEAGVTGVAPSPETSFNRTAVRPRLGANTHLEPFATLTGAVRIGANGEIGRRTSIRADEGSPIVIGADAAIEDRVTFHALKGTSIRIGTELNSDDNVVFHGPLTVGDRLSIGDDAILFRANVEDDVTIGDGAVVVGPADAPLRIPAGTQIPAGAVITDQEGIDRLQS